MVKISPECTNYVLTGSDAEKALNMAAKWDDKGVDENGDTILYTNGMRVFVLEPQPKLPIQPAVRLVVVSQETNLRPKHIETLKKLMK